jgi:ribonuclease HII
MTKLSGQFPGYGWETNMGYPTDGHRNGIRAQGITPYHRKTFQLLPSQLDLFTEPTLVEG